MVDVMALGLPKGGLMLRRVPIRGQIAIGHGGGDLAEVILAVEARELRAQTKVSS